MRKYFVAVLMLSALGASAQEDEEGLGSEATEMKVKPGETQQRDTDAPKTVGCFFFSEDGQLTVSGVAGKNGECLVNGRNVNPPDHSHE